MNGSAKIMKTDKGVDEMDGGEERTYAAPIILSAFLSVPIKKTASATVPIHIGNIHFGRLQLTPPPEGMFGWTAAYSPRKCLMSRPEMVKIVKLPHKVIRSRILMIVPSRVCPKIIRHSARHNHHIRVHRLDGGIKSFESIAGVRAPSTTKIILVANFNKLNGPGLRVPERGTKSAVGTTNGPHDEFKLIYDVFDIGR